ncbi:MAG: hypothetical protein M1820_004556 [Bogoriella megaspora]|nr:MAG: hypothetical protein M1820_004556 [Bogoriella megaspora]
MAPSTFASAAAGNNNTLSRADSGDWSRRTNGTTQTFRRSSLAASNNANSRDGPTNIGSNVYIPPHIANRNGAPPVEIRYSKDQLLDLLRQQQEAVQHAQDISALFVGGWEGRDPNGINNTESDGAPNGSAQGVDICWQRTGGIKPLGLSEMTDEEKEFFSTSVNSPLKPPVQNTPKDGTTRDGLSLRKSSVSRDNNSGSYGLTSPTAARSGNRRRDTSDSFPFPPTSVASPSGGSKFFREENTAAQPPASLMRRRTDFKENATPSETEDRDKDKAREEGSSQAPPLNTLKRSTTGPLSAGLNGPSSPWSATPQSSGFNPIGGAFGSFALGGTQNATGSETRPGFGSMRGQSRFKGLMSKDSGEDMNKAITEKPSGELGKIDEGTQSHQASSWVESLRGRGSNDELRAGSAALGGAQDFSTAAPQGRPSTGSIARQDLRDDHGFAAFGMTSDQLGFRDMLQNRESTQQLLPGQQGGLGSEEPMSPTDTNPFQSPETHPQDLDMDASDIQNASLPGLGTNPGEQDSLPGLAALGGFGNFGRGHVGAEGDRSQTSSAGPNRPFPTLSGLGGLPGLGNNAWANNAPLGTPLRERINTNNFSENFLGSSAETQSPNLAGLGSGNAFGTGAGIGFGAPGNAQRGSKLGSLFPTAMQDEMRFRDDTGHQEANITGDIRDRQPGPIGAGGQNRFDINLGKEIDSPFNLGRSSFEDILGDAALTPQNQIPSQVGIATPSSGPSAGFGQQRATQQEIRQQQPSNSSASNQPPPAQQRTMVMPDRMRWIYRDPQGNTQGPWSGLEMHDWYKAGFFSPELLVKKFEDPDYEPLAQLIRRIGNSREPFLVPQIGIPHGPPSGGPSAWASQSGAGNVPSSTGTGQPPLPSAFPSFGTTLTAEQQNALERRKQEEQYLMARQKEHLQAQQQYQRQQQMSIGPHGPISQQLQHHSSAHSLQSQPSFGSITSPNQYQPSPSQGPTQSGPNVPGFFDNSFRPPQQGAIGPIGGEQDVMGRMKEHEMPGLFGRLNLGQGGQPPFGAQSNQFEQHDPVHAQRLAQMQDDRSQLQREQAAYDTHQRFRQSEDQDSAARYQQFQQYQGMSGVPAQDQGFAEEANDTRSQGSVPEYSQPQQVHQTEYFGDGEGQTATSAQVSSPKAPTSLDNQAAQPLSLTEQVQKAASAQQSPAPQSPWAKVDTSMPQPFPPAPSQSPLPAPAAQRNRQNVAEALTAESHSRSETPVDTPTSIAPWAKESTEAPKGPSLKEIQASEAKKAAQREAEEAAARRAALEKEMMAQAMAPQPAPGLPQSSTWGSSQSPVTAGTASASAWTKPLAGKPAPGTSTGKTLAQIQKEEETRKKMAAAKASAASGSSPSAGPALSSGKRYADLAGKTAAAPNPNLGGAWTTVGASGKTKVAAAPTAPAATRTVSSGAAPAAATAAPPRPKPTSTPSRSATMGSVLTQANAQEEFKKWAVTELRQDLSKGISAEDFVANLMALPSDSDMITEAVHHSSRTIDSRHFAEEFIRRRRLADRGMVDPTGTGSPASAAEKKTDGGWSEVAKKNPTPKEDPGNFTVVPAKKKGGKR